jgi:hypothetical protein
VPVTIADPKAISSNKPPAPEPIPSKELFPTHVVLEDGREIWVSVPQPDRLSLVIPISKYVYGKKVSPDVPVEAFMEGLWAYLNDPDFPGEVVGKPSLPNSGLWKITLSFGKRDSSVLFERKNHKKHKKNCLRIEMNPRKLGPNGFADLIKVLSSSGKQFDVGCLMAAAKVTRYDVAVDIVGLHVSEIVAVHKPEGKRSLYIGSDGALETVYIHKKLQPPKAHEYDEEGVLLKKPKLPSKPAGAVALKIYDRVKLRQALGWPGPFGDCPVSRVEMARESLKDTWLANLADLTDPLKTARVGIGVDQTKHSSLSWNRYMTVRRATSATEAASILGLPPETAQSFDHGLAVPVPNLVAPNVNWKWWINGLQLTGVAMLIEKAQAAPPLSFEW